MSSVNGLVDMGQNSQVTIRQTSPRSIIAGLNVRKLINVPVRSISDIKYTPTVPMTMYSINLLMPNFGCL